MKVFYMDKEIGNIITNRSMTIEEALYSIGIDVKDPKDCEEAYENGFEPAYMDDCGNYCIDVENCYMVY